MNLSDTFQTIQMTQQSGFRQGYLVMACLLMYIALLLYINSERRKLYILNEHTKHWCYRKIHEFRIKTAARIKRSVIKAEERKEKLENERKKKQEEV